MIKWAIQNGNWSDTTTWNDGVVPTVNDVVYCNGYRIVLDVDGVADTISNDENPNTLRSGGYIYITTIRTLTANIIGVNANPIHYYVSSANNTQTIIGNINLTGTYINWDARGGYPECTINGNILLNNGSQIFNYTSANPQTNVINGNITVNNGCRMFNTNNNFTINGTLVFNEGSSNLTALKVNGIFENHIALSQTLSINGEIKNYGQLMGNVTFTGDAILKYYGVDDSMGLACGSIVFQSPNSIQFIKMNVADYPQPEDVRKNITYDFGRLVGTLEQEIKIGCVTPEDVRKDVPLVGMGVVGTLVVPSVDDVREGVVFDNGSVGTLIVQGGGDRLRIADFGYYTNAQSDTYIVDLTEQDKPKFAVAEERVLIEMFPDLDLDNIPDKYFDDLFVKYLKYRLIVEYYRTAGINSTFTPSEPTTEIVNYQNVRNEVWLNSANIYLKAWGKKYPESIMKPQRILL